MYVKRKKYCGWLALLIFTYLGELLNSFRIYFSVKIAIWSEALVCKMLFC